MNETENAIEIGEDVVSQTITLTPEQARAVAEALELAFRIHLGQFDVLADVWATRVGGDGLRAPDRLPGLEMARVALDKAKMCLTGFGRSSSYGVGAPEIGADAHRVFDVLQVVRNAVVATEPEKFHAAHVWRDRPMFYAGDAEPPQAKVEEER